MEDNILPADEANELTLKSCKHAWTKLFISAEEIIIQSGKLQIKIPTFWSLEDVQELTFIIKDKEYKFRRVIE